MFKALLVDIYVRGRGGRGLSILRLTTMVLQLQWRRRQVGAVSSENQRVDESRLDGMYGH